MESRNVMLEKNQHYIYISLIVIMVIFAISISVYLASINKDIIHSVKILQSGVNSIKNNIGKADTIELSSNDEFEQLANAYNSMLVIIRRQMKNIEENADMKERLYDAEKRNLQIYSDLQKNHLDFLQSRINPHFLFNTLNMISAQARIEQADKSAELIELTASNLRYNLDNIKKTVTLEKEVHNLMEYIQIQKYRYTDRFNFDVSIDKESKNAQLPCLVLQPLVENSIKHGIGMMVSGGVVSVAAYKVEDRVIIETKDNGVGISEQNLEKVKREIECDSSEGNHIGIYNIYQRLKLFYGNKDVKVDLKNIYPGLLISISIPYIADTKTQN